MKCKQWKAIKDKVKKVEDYLHKELKTSQELIKEVVLDLFKAGGKRLRPALLITAAQFGDYDEAKVYKVAAAVEMLHMATLIHDDIIDESNLRRGVKSAQAKYGKDVAVFAGDYLFSLAFSILSREVVNLQVERVSNIIKQICKGEIKQYQSRYNTAFSRKEYLKMCKNKTAVLFEGSCALGGGLANLEKAKINLLGDYGLYLGMSFQITDDILDFTQDKEELGKLSDNDFTQGIYTLPIIYTIAETDLEESLTELLKNPRQNKEEIKEIIRISGGLNYARQIANKYIKKAKSKVNKLPKNEYSILLKELAEKIRERRF